ncbi:MAG: 16S rRNA (uracil(1498)-N(3))-methyltransferase [Alphaproteobacteria bacterium]|nr:16S rRNA (uracil(1498)-N(3))-methyltransferase [Alphaproteobacteria bacterium]
MKNIPRIFIGKNIIQNTNIVIDKSVVHYLSHVMRRNDCLVFGDGNEYVANLTPDQKYLAIGNQTPHTDPSNDITLYFAPIKKLDDMLNMATQMGIGRFVPVITERTVANHINWERMKKIVIEASEQSNRNSVPEIASPIKFADLPFSELVFADERAAYGADLPHEFIGVKNILIGPEGGFSNNEFDALDKNGARGMSLGKTILRAELAASIAISRVIK